MKSAPWLLVAVLSQPGDLGAPPGRLVAVDGRQIHIHCTGSGSPTVILEAGASAFAIDFALVQPEIAKTTRVCSYDRAGHGWSTERKAIDTPPRVLADLHSTLGAAGEKPPYVFVGASFGAIYARLYQLEHPSDVVGFVLVDPATEDRLFTMFQEKMVPIGTLTAEQLRTTLPASGTYPNQAGSRSPQTGAPFDKLPKNLYDLRIKLDARLIALQGPTMAAEAIREFSEGNRAGFARLLESRTVKEPLMRNVPAVVLTRGINMTPGIAENHAALAKLSTNSRHTIVDGAGHEIHLFAPAQVIQAVQDVVESHRTKKPLRRP